MSVTLCSYFTAMGLYELDIWILLLENSRCTDVAYLYYIYHIYFYFIPSVHPYFMYFNRQTTHFLEILQSPDNIIYS